MTITYNDHELEVTNEGLVPLAKLAKTMGYSGSQALKGIIKDDVEVSTQFNDRGMKTNYLSLDDFLSFAETHKMHLPRVKDFVEHVRSSEPLAVSQIDDVDDGATLFDFDGDIVRVVLEDGEPWFVLKDVCDVLGLRPDNVKPRLHKDDHCTTGVTDRLGRSQRVTTVNESGLYDVILDSRKPQAKRFRRWVTSEVLPSIRKDGGYIQGQEDMTGEELMLKAMEFAKSRIERLEREAEQNRPKVEFAENVEATDSTITLTEMAQILNSSVCEASKFSLPRTLIEHGYLYRKPVNGIVLPIKKYVDQGLFEVKEMCYWDSYQKALIPTLQTRVTGKGQIYFVRKFNSGELEIV